MRGPERSPDKIIMNQAIQTSEPTKIDEFTAFTGRIQSLIAQSQPERIESSIVEYNRTSDNQAHKLLLQGVLCCLKQQYLQAVRLMQQADALLPPEQYPDPGSIYSQVFIQSQLALPEKQRPTFGLGEKFYHSNIRTLEKVDPGLANEVRNCPWPHDFTLLHYWSGLHLFALTNNVLLTLTDPAIKSLTQPVTQRSPITFAGVGTGQELRYCLAHRVDFLHGMARTHYLFEPNIKKIKMLLHLDDFDPFFDTQELIIFGGAGLPQRSREIFGTLRYYPPGLIVGKSPDIQNYVEDINQQINGSFNIDRVKEYYASDEFHSRLKNIADGSIQPRILVVTCRWTTFLQHCANDFRMAFEKTGCETQLLIEENDIQNASVPLHWREFEQFKPDVVFSVSHARPSTPYAPPQLPYIGYIQDRVGPIFKLPDLAEHIQPHDLFACQAGYLQSYLNQKNIPTPQTFVLPVPADENVCYPLENDHPQADKFTADISFVKHGHPHPDEVYQNFLKQYLAPMANQKLAEKLKMIFDQLYQACPNTGPKHPAEKDMLEFVMSCITDAADDTFRQQMWHLVILFNITVCTAAWRAQFLEALAASDLQVRLYGKNWEQYPALKNLSYGPAAHKDELNCVYNFSRINLNINNVNTMHQRLVECALAGGFIMAANIPPDKDWEPASNYFEPDKELVYFDTPADLIDKCRYYLAHPDERQQIAHNMHCRALEQLTTVVTARKMLQKWRELL
jgi:spore maturation protein CgeB